MSYCSKLIERNRNRKLLSSSSSCKFKYIRTFSLNKENAAYGSYNCNLEDAVIDRYSDRYIDRYSDSYIDRYSDGYSDIDIEIGGDVDRCGDIDDEIDNNSYDEIDNFYKTNLKIDRDRDSISNTDIEYDIDTDYQIIENFYKAHLKKLQD
jgi:hypothetical protein